MNFFGIGLPEMAVIAAIGLLVFGPKRLPELGRTLGRTLKGFQSASREFEQEFRNAIDTEAVAAAAAAPPLAGAPGATSLADAVAVPDPVAVPEEVSPPAATPPGPQAAPLEAVVVPADPGAAPLADPSPPSAG